MGSVPGYSDGAVRGKELHLDKYNQLGDDIMPDWTAPFKIPKYTTAEFRKLKADYVAKNGYTITFPGLSQIIKIPIEIPMTIQEDKDWKARKFKNFSEQRLYDLRKMKQKRKDKFLAMLASPAPDIVTNAGALMCSIDDAQDALFTIGGIGVAAMRFSPPPVMAALALPTGIILTAANALSIIGSIGHQRLPGKQSKRAWQKKTGIDPWSKKGRIKFAKHLVKTFPVKAGIIQALQTTDSIFGVGISLGPIVGLFIDIFAGPVRRILGDRVDVKVPIPTYDELTRVAQKASRSSAAYWSVGVQTQDEEVITMMLSHWLSQLALFSGTEGLPNWTNFENLDDLELMARRPDNTLTLEVIQEEGLCLDDICGWPHNSKPWAAATDIVSEYSAPAQDYFLEYCSMHNFDWLGFMFATLACDATFYTMATAEGADQVEYDFTATSKACSILLENRLVPEPDLPAAKIQLLADRLDSWEAQGIEPTLRSILDFCESSSIELISF